MESFCINEAMVFARVNHQEYRKSLYSFVSNAVFKEKVFQAYSDKKRVCLKDGKFDLL